MIDKDLETISSSNTKSPCVRNCCLDKEDVCLGCFRHIEEIVGWSKFSDKDKQQIFERCEERKLKMNKMDENYIYLT